jgi:hypothetical protein
VRPRDCASVASREVITYPYARLDAGRLVHIRDYDGVAPVCCFGCGDAMVARRGRVRRWHFAHSVDSGLTCSHETALHAAAKQAILEGFAKAKASAASYLMHWQCKGCSSRRNVDLVPICRTVGAETEMVPGVISDLAFDGPRPLAVEIVVTHPPDGQALARYEAANVPVFIVRPDWDGIAMLFDGFRSDESHFVDQARCPECDRRRRALEERERVRRYALERVRKSLAKLTPRPEPFHPWKADARGNALHPPTQNKVHSTGRKLQAVGFRQTTSKPWLFVFEVRGVGSFFANLGGTEEVPIWRDPTPSFHCLLAPAFDEEADEEGGIEIARVVRGHLATRGVETRTYFFSPY